MEYASRYTQVQLQIKYFSFTCQNLLNLQVSSVNLARIEVYGNDGTYPPPCSLAYLTYCDNIRIAEPINIVTHNNNKDDNTHLYNAT